MEMNWYSAWRQGHSRLRQSLAKSRTIFCRAGRDAHRADWSGSSGGTSSLSRQWRSEVRGPFGFFGPLKGASLAAPKDVFAERHGAKNKNYDREKAYQTHAPHHPAIHHAIHHLFVSSRGAPASCKAGNPPATCATFVMPICLRDFAANAERPPEPQ